MEATITVLMVPPKEATPNAHEHYFRKAAAVKDYRHASKMAVVNALNTDGHAIIPFEGYYDLIELDAEIQWRGRRLPLDHDNAIASLKPLIDGISDALWDSRDGHIAIGRVTQTRGPGETVVTLRAIGEEGAE
jgi:hypothetical protein